MIRPLVFINNSCYTARRMYIGLRYSPQRLPPLPNSTRMTGRAFRLEIVRDDDRGPWYPSVTETDSPDSFRFFAGRISGTADIPAVDWPSLTADPEGSWIAFTFDRHRDLLRVAADRFCLQRWYYAERSDGWYISNSLLFLHHLVDNTLEIEPRAIGPMLSFGYLPFEITPLAGVRALSPGKALSIDTGQSAVVARTSTFTLPDRTEPPLSDPSAAILDSLRLAIRQDLAGVHSVIIPLSGGMDSRFALGCALEILPREAITTVTFGHPRSLDYRIGTGLAQKLGAHHSLGQLTIIQDAE